MPIVEFSVRDLKRGTIVEPAWYTCRVTSVGEAPSKKGDSTNYPVEFEIVCNADNGDTTHAGVPVTNNFNSKAIGRAVGFIESIAGAKPEPGKRIDLAAAEGRLIDVFIENDIYEGRPKNAINHKYRPATQR